MRRLFRSEERDRDVLPSTEFGFAKYTSMARWASYWHQLAYLERSQSQSVIIVGVGDQIVPNIAASKLGCQVFGVDINSELGVTSVADVRRLPFTDSAVDTAVCCQVLEHLPWESLPEAVAELARVSKSGFLVSVPVNPLGIGIRVTSNGRSDLFGTVARSPRLLKRKVGAEHYWEVDSNGVATRGAFLDTLKKFGSTSSFEIPEHPYHLFVEVKL